MKKEKKPFEHYFTSNPTSNYSPSMISAILRDKVYNFFTSQSVFSKKRIDPGTKLLIEKMILPKEGTILDLGCGYGAIGIVAASINPKLNVIMTDINFRSIELAKLNLKKNRVKNALVKKGNLYDPVKDLVFNCILLNPPISAGMNVVKTMIVEAPKKLVPQGLFQMVIKSKIGANIFPELFQKTFSNFKIISRAAGYRVLLGKKIDSFN
jgi:16S rRNA G1207 methylase RsmC